MLLVADVARLSQVSEATRRGRMRRRSRQHPFALENLSHIPLGTLVLAEGAFVKVFVMLVAHGKVEDGVGVLGQLVTELNAVVCRGESQSFCRSRRRCCKNDPGQSYQRSETRSCRGRTRTTPATRGRFRRCSGAHLARGGPRRQWSGLAFACWLGGQESTEIGADCLLAPFKPEIWCQSVAASLLTLMWMTRAPRESASTLQRPQTPASTTSAEALSDLLAIFAAIKAYHLRHFH